VQVPAQPLLRSSALVDKVVAVVDEQLQLTQPLLARTRVIQARLAQGGPGDRQRIDRIGLTADPARAP